MPILTLILPFQTTNLTVKQTEFVKGLFENIEQLCQKYPIQRKWQLEQEIELQKQRRNEAEEAVVRKNEAIEDQRLRWCELKAHADEMQKVTDRLKKEAVPALKQTMLLKKRLSECYTEMGKTPEAAIRQAHIDAEDWDGLAEHMDQPENANPLIACFGQD